MINNKFKPYPKKEEPDREADKHHAHPPHPELPPHILKEIFDLKEKVGRLEGKVDILTMFVGKSNK